MAFLVSSGFTLVQHVSDSSPFLWRNIVGQVHSPWSSPAETGPGPECGRGGSPRLAALTSTGSSSRSAFGCKDELLSTPSADPIGSPGASLGTGGCAAPVVQLPDAVSRLRPGNVWARRAERAPQDRRREEPRLPAQRWAPPPQTSSGISRAGLLCVPSCMAGTGLALCGAAAGLRPHSWCPQVTRNKSRVGTCAGGPCEPACAVCRGGVHVTRVQEAWARLRRWRP